MHERDDESDDASQDTGREAGRDTGPDAAELPAARFETHRPRLRAVAYRMLGSSGAAEDAVQETWLRLSRTDTSDVRDLGAWLMTVVAGVTLTMLRSRETRRENLWAARQPEPAVRRDADPEHEALLADSVGLALLVVLDTLTPAERLAFVLHDMFDVPFEEIAPIIERSSAATRKLASGARIRVREATASPEVDTGRRREVVVVAFLAAAREGDVDALLALLDPDVVLRADGAAVLAGAGAGGARGAVNVAKTVVGRAKAARPVLINGAAGLVWAPGGTPRVVVGFTFAEAGGGAVGRIVAIDVLADPEYLGGLELEILDEPDESDEPEGG